MVNYAFTMYFRMKYSLSASVDDIKMSVHGIALPLSAQPFDSDDDKDVRNIGMLILKDVDVIRYIRL